MTGKEHTRESGTHQTPVPCDETNQSSRGANNNKNNNMNPTDKRVWQECLTSVKNRKKQGQS